MRLGIACYPTFGGSGVVATEVGMEMARRGHEVHFISYAQPTRLDGFADAVYYHQVEQAEYPVFRGGHYALSLASKLVEVHQYHQLDIVHVHYAVPHAASAYLANQVLGENAPKLITTLHGTDTTLVGSDPSYLPITRFCIEQSDAVTVPSAFLAKATRTLLGVSDAVDIQVIPNFVDTARYHPAPQCRHKLARELFGDRLGPEADAAKVVVHVSNFRPVKRVTDVVRAFALLRKQQPAHLILVGDGPDRPKVRSLVTQLGLHRDVCFLGKQSSFVAVLQASDVFVLPSETESFGLAALEALSCGVPVVASRTGGIPEVVDDGKSGFLCDVGDIEGFAHALTRLVTEQDLHRDMAQAARQRAESVFRAEPLLDKYEALYRATLE